MKSIKKMIRTGGCLFLSVLCVMLFCSVAVGAPVAKSNGSSPLDDTITIIAGQSKVVKAPWAAVRIAVTDPKVANVQLLTPDQVLVQGNKIGSTDLILWNADETNIWRSRINVSLDIEQYQQKLLGMFPRADLQLDQSGDVLIVKGLLRSAGEVVQLHNFLDKAAVNYVDMTSVAGIQQVQLDVRVAEVSRTAIRALGVNTFWTDGDSFLGVRPGSGSGAFVPGLGPDAASPFSDGISGTGTVFGGFSVNGSDFRTFIQALAENQYLRVLANPTLVALSGEDASFLAGGEFPIPVVQSGTGGGENGTSITIEYKEFGVRLSFRPTVLGDGTIRLYVAPEVSDLTTVGSVIISGFEVPALKTRKFETTMELKSGQTFAMAGLIKNNEDAITSRVPGLSTLPVLGPLFRSVRYNKNETEMVVLVTASLVEPMNSAEVPPVPGFMDVTPNDWELYIEGRIEGKAPAKISSADANWLRQMGLDKLMGPGAWDSYGNPVAPSQAETVKAAQ